jgi:hypothetical protein
MSVSDLANLATEAVRLQREASTAFEQLRVALRGQNLRPTNVKLFEAARDADRTAKLMTCSLQRLQRAQSIANRREALRRLRPEGRDWRDWRGSHFKENG